MMNVAARHWWHAVALAVSITACSPAARLEPVTGLVIFEDGQPVGGGFIEFAPVSGSGPGARGRIGPDGRFRLSTGGRDGAVAGTYRVAVMQVGEASPRHGPHAHPTIDQRFASFETSGLDARVTAGENDLTIRVGAAGTIRGPR